MTDFVIGDAGDIEEGERHIVELEGMEFSVFKKNGDYYAYVNWCPHQGGPICEGKFSGTTEERFDRDTLEYTTEWVKEGEIVVCPWHGWEFDIVSGESVHQPTVKIPSRPVRVEDGELIISV